jgi:hypothetical protein
VVNGERRDAVLGQLELFRALAEDNEREQQPLRDRRQRLAT